MIKEASIESFLMGVVNTVSDKVNLKEKPFETIFATIGLAMGFSFNIFLGLFLLALETSGNSLSDVGAKIDQALGFGEGKEPKMPSDAQISSVAKDMVDNVFSEEKADEVISDAANFLGVSKAEAMISNIKEIKGEINDNDIFVALACTNDGLIKNAGLGTWFKALLGFKKAKFAKKRSWILSAVIWFIKIICQFIFGTVMLGIGGGVAAVYNEDKSGKTPEDPIEIQNQKIKGTLYKNTTGDVKSSIINLLDSKYDFDDNGKKISFSDAFQKQNNMPIENSPQMNGLLHKIRMKNHGEDLFTISRYPTFRGPELSAIFSEFFPNAPKLDAQVAESKPINTPKLSKRENNENEISSLLKEMKG